MARINTNIGSLVAQHQLLQTNEDLNRALQRLSTGVRINSGKDDPAGLISSEGLRSDIANLNKAISNSQRANNIVQTADGALGQVSTLLNSIKGLIVETANNGGVSQDQIAADQLQIDSALEAINRIALTTTFQGRRLLDGSLGFSTDIGTLPEVKAWRIDQADLGVTGAMNVDVVMNAKATQAGISNSSFTNTQANATLSFPVRSPAVLGDIHVQALDETQAVTIQFQYSGSVPSNTVQASYNSNTRSIRVTANASTATSISKAQVAAAIDALSGFSAQANSATANSPAGNFTSGGVAPNQVTLQPTDVTFAANQLGADFNNIEISLKPGTSTTATYDSNLKTIQISYIPGVTTIANLALAIDGLADFNLVSNNNLNAVLVADDIAVSTNTGLSGGGALTDKLVFELAGSTGTQTYNFQTGTTSQDIANAINLNSEATNVGAYVDSQTDELVLQSTDYGSQALVDLHVTDEGPNGAFRSGFQALHDTGSDMVATVNGSVASSKGQQISVNTSTLSLMMDLDQDAITGPLRFAINGGGALFQIGGDIVSGQQVRMGIESISTSSLGGPSGRLYELGSGQAKSLTADIGGADRVINDVISRISLLRGRLGAFQSTTVDSNSNALSEAVSNLTEAESSIRDADFASETAQLTRAQVLVQSGLQVLGIANQNPQNVLRLLGQ